MVKLQASTAGIIGTALHRNWATICSHVRRRASSRVCCLARLYCKHWPVEPREIPSIPQMSLVRLTVLCVQLIEAEGSTSGLLHCAPEVPSGSLPACSACLVPSNDACIALEKCEPWGDSTWKENEGCECLPLNHVANPMVGRWLASSQGGSKWHPPHISLYLRAELVARDWVIIDVLVLVCQEWRFSYSPKGRRTSFFMRRFLSCGPVWVGS